MSPKFTRSSKAGTKQRSAKGRSVRNPIIEMRRWVPLKKN